MIQRIQSVWLLLGALLNACTIFAPFYNVPVTEGVNKSIIAANNYPSLLLTITVVILPLITIFMFKKRKQQIKMSIISIVGTILLITFMVSRVTGLLKSMPQITGGTYWISSILLPLSIIMFILAIIGIRKDDKLVKSTDRLR